MKQNLLQRYSLLLIVLLALLMVGCQRVSDARTEFCDSLSDVGTLATEFKSAKVDAPVDQFKSKVETLQEKKQRLDRLAKVSPGPALDRLAAAMDNVAAAVGTVSGNTLGPAVDKIQAAGAELESAYLAADEAVCAAK